MKRLCLASFVASAFFASVQALGADGSSGCGPGWYVLKDNSILSSSLRATTNGILWPSTTVGMTLGTSNCAKHKLVEKEKESLHFATMAYHDLQVQMAQGKGSHLSAFAATLGCDWRAQEAFNKAIQANYDNVFPSSDVNPTGLVGNVVETIQANPELAARCTAGLG